MRFGDLKYILAYLLPAAAYFSVFQGSIWSYTAFILAFVILPLIELVLPLSNQGEVSDYSGRQVHPFFDVLLYVNIPLVYGLIFFFLWRISTSPLSTYELIGMTFSVGVIIGANGINVAHELGHRSTKLEQWMAKLLLLPALYQHFFIEHNRGHHRYVGTYDDPSTARFGESLYQFWLRSVSKCFISAWNLEKERLKKNGLPIIGINNQMFHFAILQFIYLFVLGYIFGLKYLTFVIFIAIIGFLLLESINYIEHYGLRRLKKPNGAYEKVAMKHSWNSNHDLGRIFLYELTRHADHHYKASKKYQTLRHIEDSPQLPVGYPASIILAMVPPVWFRIMNKRVPKEMLHGN